MTCANRVGAGFSRCLLAGLLLMTGLLFGCQRPPADRGRASTATEPETAGLRILFLGNSHTSTGDVVGLVRQLIRLADPSATVCCETIHGPFLDALAARSPVRQRISGGHWDVVVLQGQKVSRSGRYTVEPAVELCRLAEAAGARVLLFSEWGRRGIPDETRHIQEICQSIADRTQARVSPVGQAWELARQRNPRLQLHAADGNHSSLQGAFLTASVLCGSICQRLPAEWPVLPDGPVAPDVQRFLHACARDVLTAGPDESTSLPVQASGSRAGPDRAVSSGPRWYRGNLHTHSLWSDGDDFPEMITRWYVENGYQFLAMTDHNILARGERWMDESTIEQRGGRTCLDKYRDAFGDTLMQTREQDGETRIRLTPLAEYRGVFESPGEFLLIEGEEVSDAVQGMPVHINATHLTQVLQPAGGATVREAIDNNLRVAAEQSRQTGQPILMHVNHPNFGWAITAEDLAAVTRARFFEAYNGHNSVNHQGDGDHPSVERIWDIANTLRIDKLGSPPLYGIASDDSHYYHGRPGSHPGRGWVMVRSAELSADALLNAMQRGEFYASSGVVLSNVAFDPVARELRLRIDGAEGVRYCTEFIGTRRGYNQQAEPREGTSGDPARITRKYSAEIGEVLATDHSLNPACKLTGDELYVRAVVTSDRAHPDPSFAGQTEQAWTQPVGWEER